MRARPPSLSAKNVRPSLERNLEPMTANPNPRQHSPIIGVANTWIETMPCNYHLRHLAVKVKEGIRAAGGTPMEFNTIAISDGITMGTEGMKASLVSREVIADSIELVGRGHMFDAVI